MRQILTATPRLALLCLFVVLFQSPVTQNALAGPQVEQQAKRVTLKLENTEVQTALKLLFQSVGKDYAIAPGVKGAVTLSVTDVPFRLALEQLLRVCTEPLTYRVEGGIYNILPRGGTPAAPPFEPETPSRKTMLVQLNYAHVKDLMRSFESDRKALVPPGVSIAAGANNTLLVQYSDDDALRALKELIRLLDVSAPQIEIRAELVLVLDGQSLERQHGLLSTVGRTRDQEPLTVKTSLEGGSATFGGLRLTSGLSILKVTPKRNGDNSIDLSADWTLDLIWQPAHGGKPIHIHKTFSGSLRASDADTLTLTGSVIRLGHGSGKETDGEILLYLTPRVLPDGSGHANAYQPGVVHTALSLGVRDRMTGAIDTEASEALARELAESTRFEIIPAEAAEKAARKLGLAAPFDVTAQDRIASELNAQSVISGEVVRLPGKPGGTALTVRVRDIRTGGLRTARAAIALPRHAEATHMAAYQASRAILAYQSIEGTVLTTSGPSGGRALVNRGASDGIAVGSELVVTRADRRVGRLRVVRVYPADCETAILEGARVIRPEDRVEAYVPGRTAAPVKVQP